MMFLRWGIESVLIKPSVNIYQIPIVGLILKLVFGEKKHRIQTWAWPQRYGTQLPLSGRSGCWTSEGSVGDSQPPHVTSLRVCFICREMPHQGQTFTGQPTLGKGLATLAGCGMLIVTLTPEFPTPSAPALLSLHHSSAPPSVQSCLPHPSHWYGSLINNWHPELCLRICFWRTQPATPGYQWS